MAHSDSQIWLRLTCQTGHSANRLAPKGATAGMRLPGFGMIPFFAQDFTDQKPGCAIYVARSQSEVTQCVQFSDWY